MIFSTVIFALNTFDVFSLFFLISNDFNQDVSSLGLISATMTIGIGLFQIPGGMMAARFGPILTSTVGMILIASGGILVGLSTDMNQIAIFRFVLGGGLAFFFPSAIVLAGEYSKKGSEGLGVGSLIGANAAGGAIGLIGWALIADVIGWRTSIILGGILALIAAAALFFLLSKKRTMTVEANISQPNIAKFTVKLPEVRKILADKSLIIFGILLLGSQIVLEQTLAFMPFYLQSSFNVAGSLAGLVASVTLLGALIGSPVIGWLYDKKISFMKLIVIFASTLLVGVSINFTNNFLPATLISTAMVGFSGGGLFTLFSNAGREKISLGAASGKYHKEYVTLSVNWIHCIALTGTFWAPILFSMSAATSGYQVAWPLIGLISFAIIIGTALTGYRKQMIANQQVRLE